MLTFIRSSRRVIFVLCGLALLLMPGIALAATNKKTADNPSSSAGSATDTTGTQAVTQGYGSDTTLQKGMIVKLVDKDSTKVEPVKTTDADKMEGVVVAANAAAVTLSNNSNSGQVFVATYGKFDVLVSNQNGPIKSGDYVTISALDGVGMKVDTTQSAVLGRATADFNGNNNVQGTAKLKDAPGNEVTISLGRIPVDINVGHNPLQQSADKNLPGFLKEASRTVANKPVNPTRVYLGLIVLFISSLVAGGMLYSGIRGGLVAIGRNPLAKKAIIAGIFRVVLSGLIVFIIGLFGVYLLLKL